MLILLSAKYRLDNIRNADFFLTFDLNKFFKQVQSADLNWTIIIVVGIAVVALLIFINKRNLKDEEDMEDTMNKIDRKHLESDEDTDSTI